MKPVIVFAITVGVGVLTFFGGIQYQKSQSVNNQRGQFGGNQNDTQGGQGRMRTGSAGNPTTEANFQGNKPVSGEIASIDKNTITIKTQDGSSKIIIYSAQTKVNKTSEGTTSDLKSGTQINVVGSETTNGTVTAQSISIGAGLMQVPGEGQQPPSQNGQSTAN